ncbi:hypothetical protein ACRCRN_32270 [Pseudomonas aeruginosa]|jgi:hypothetical protein
MDNRTVKHLMRNPLAMANYRATGKAPQFRPPSSPLITLLQSLYPRERALITALRVNDQLGYQGGRQFHNAAQALNWLLPANPGTHIPSESWQNKRFQKVLTVDDLARHARVPASVIDAWWRRHPQLASMRQAAETPSNPQAQEDSQ